MSATKYPLFGAALLVATTLAAAAQTPYPPYGYYPPNPMFQPSPYSGAPSTPSAWSYDPYTSGLTACPQRYRGEPPCSETMPPSFGQPNYRAR